MKLIKYIILGIIQGFTEPLPVSSSGHIFIFKYLFNSNISNNLSFEIIVNAGSLLAVCLIYRKRLISLLEGFILYLKDRNIRYESNYKYSLYILVGCLPAGIIGFLFKDYIDYDLNFEKFFLKPLEIMTGPLKFNVHKNTEALELW